MRGRWIVTIVAACSSKELLVDVDTNGTNTATVELMIVDSDCTAGSADCAGIGPPGAITKPAGSVYYLDGDDRLAATPVGGHARFALEAGNTDFTPRVLAVGFGSGDQPTSLVFVQDVDVSKYRGEIWRLALEPRTFVGPTPAPVDLGANDAITLWRPPRDADPAVTGRHASCAMIDHADRSPPEFIVPPGDPDCDTFTGDQECDASWYRHVVTMSPTTTCIAPQTDGTCMPGVAASCIDGTGKGGCGVGNVCVPTIACTACASGTNPNCDDTIAGLPATPRIVCDVPVQDNGGMFMPCSGMAATLDAAMAFSSGCSAPGLINALEMPPTPQQSIAFTLAGAGSGTMMIKNTTADPCQVDLAIDGVFTAIPVRTRVGSFMLSGPTRRIDVPIQLNLTTGGCSVGSHTTCAFVPDFTDHIWLCAK